MHRTCAVGLALFLTAVASAGMARGQTLWREGAENGLTYVVDGTPSTYALIQSDVAVEGSSAFHLANPAFQDSWFSIDQDIAIAADTKLFFQSQLSWAGTGQLAKVQVSTDGGSSWPTDIYSQAGDGSAGEGAFNLRQVDLGTYANQSLRFRFLYDYTGGLAFTQTTTNIGWRIDDIQIGSALAKQRYSVGDPSTDEQLYLELINRARADAVVEANRLASETDPDITSAYSFFGIDRQDIVDQFQWSVNNGVLDQFAQPLSFNEDLLRAARLHSQDMFDNRFQGHTSSANPPEALVPNGRLSDRVNAVGYAWRGLAENVFAYADSPAAGHAGFNVDWGNSSVPDHPDYNPEFVGQGMQNPAGHRNSIHSDSFKEIGVGVVNGTNGPVGPQIVTQVFGDPGAATFVTGVVYEDVNGNQFYDAGEGRGGVRVDINESAFYALSSESGAYSIPVSADGSYLVEFSGGGFADHSISATVVGGANVKVDYLAFLPSYHFADYNQNASVDSGDYDLWKELFGSTDLRADGNNDQRVDMVDYVAWRDALGATAATGATGATGTAGSKGNNSEFATAVPEPTAGALLGGLVLASLSMAMGRSRRQRG